MGELDREKLDKLAGHIMILRLPRGTVKQELVDQAYKDAKALAGELFPPQAAPLVWQGNRSGNRSGNYFVREIGECVYVPQIRNNNGHVPRYDDIGPASSLCEAKAFCERHHQRSFARSFL